MSDIIDNKTGLDADKLTQLYSADRNRNGIQQEQTNSLYGINYILYYIYYTLVLYFILTRFRSYVMNNAHFYKNLTIFFLLLVYPYIIYPVQFYLFRIGKSVQGALYSNVYMSEDW